MTGSAIRKPRIHPGRGSARDGLDDRGPDEGDWQVIADLEEGVLAERLRKGVGVRPSESPGPAPAELHHAVVHPVAA